MKLRTWTTATALTAALTTAAAGTATALPLPDFGSADVFGSMSAQGPHVAPVITSVANFRDVTGPGYTGHHGKKLKPGVFYRSSAPLGTSEADKAQLAAIGMTRSFDMRHTNEIESEYIGGLPQLPPGTVYEHAEIGFADLITLAFQLQSVEDARQYMRDTNVRFVTEQDRLDGFKQVLEGLAAGSDPQMFHCTSGKDRTGWVSYLLLSIAGVDEATIMNDYLKSNEALAGINAATLDMVGGYGLDKDIFEQLLIVEPSYLQTGIDKLKADYGTVDNYLRSGLGLDQSTIHTLRHKLIG